MARASDLDRRSFLIAAGAALLLPRRAFAAESLPETTQSLLEKSGFVYVSPLKKDGSESTCHGEVWFAWLDGTVVINTRRGTWKAQALEKGLDRARIWVGDHGRWKGVLGGGGNEAFRTAPSFEAKARFETDKAVNDRLLAKFEQKYGAEFKNRWHEDMKTGFFSGHRKLIRYEPV